eukprot:c10880_g2_i1.p1 GENE.c10880_g2_i1~~c10880_g2_i1.p1  ORF type:complete len:208 (-),score=47.83 c10880_g2_i1:36-659(-)
MGHNAHFRPTMKFHFCGDLDCPDWLLQEIALLSKISAVKMRLLCAEVATGIQEGNLNFDKVYKYTADAKFGHGEVKASVAALRFIIVSASRFDVSPSTLAKELQQLGLPKEHSDGLCKMFSDKKDHITAALHRSSLKLPRVTSVDWRVDYLLDSSAAKKVDEPSIQLRLGTSHSLEGVLSQSQHIVLETNPTNLSILLHGTLNVDWK